MMKHTKSICGTLPQKQNKGSGVKTVSALTLAAGLALASSGAMAAPMASISASTDMSAITFATTGTLVITPDLNNQFQNNQLEAAAENTGGSPSVVNYCATTCSASTSGAASQSALNGTLISGSAQASNGYAYSAAENGFMFTATGVGNLTITIPYTATYQLQPGASGYAYVSIYNDIPQFLSAYTSDEVYVASNTISPVTISSSTQIKQNEVTPGQYGVDLNFAWTAEATPTQTSPVPELPVPLMLSVGMLVPLLTRRTRKQMPS